MPKEATFAIKNIDNKRGTINFICSNMDLPDADRQRLLEARACWRVRAGCWRYWCASSRSPS